jgi:hypothetical protein
LASVPGGTQDGGSPLHKGTWGNFRRCSSLSSSGRCTGFCGCLRGLRYPGMGTRAKCRDTVPHSRVLSVRDGGWPGGYPFRPGPETSAGVAVRLYGTERGWPGGRMNDSPGPVGAALVGSYKSRDSDGCPPTRPVFRGVTRATGVGWRCEKSQPLDAARPGNHPGQCCRF